MNSGTPSAMQRSVTRARNHPVLATLSGVGAALMASALFNRSQAAKAERQNPPQGKFLTINGVRLHFVERGAGETLLLLHGNGSMIEDFESSGLLDRAASSYRVIAFDRPGFGHSNRPQDVNWTPDAQADLFVLAMKELEVERALVLGHSWAASVAVAMALRHPHAVSGLVLASGFYFPAFRPDFILAAAPALPLLGVVISNTIAPLVSRLSWPLIRKKLFSPARVPEKFAGFPMGMVVRPSQIEASAAESALMLPDAAHLQDRYTELRIPVAIVAGEGDRIVDTDQQSGRLAGLIPDCEFTSIAGAGHMVHQTAPEAVLAVILRLSRRVHKAPSTTLVEVQATAA